MEVFFKALAIPVNREGRGNWMRLLRQHDTVSVVTNVGGERPRNLCAFSGLGRRVYPGFVMVLLSAMQSGVTDNLINALRLSLGVARRTLQLWRHWLRAIFVGIPFWNLGKGRFMPPIEHAALPSSLL